jgi:putative SOS response-associated peptidase YedK
LIFSHAPFLATARSDTLYQKATFSKLVNTGKTCLIALDGFFEWKQESVVGNSKAKKKQPYFVYRKKKLTNGSRGVDAESTATTATLEQEPCHRPFLLMAGLWTRVSTGRTDTKMLDTFTIITTEACPCLEWLHTRMPVFVWDDDLARQWLLNPSQRVYQQIVKQAKATTSSPSTTTSSSSSSSSSSTTPQQQKQQQQVDSNGDRFLDWHAVTTEMSKTKFRSADSIKPLPKPKTVKSFFATAAAAAAAAAQASNNKSKMKHDSADDDKRNEKQLQDNDAASSTTTKPATAAAESPPRKRPATATSKQQSSEKKSKTTASTKNATSSTPKKGSIEYFFASKPKTEKK